MDFNTKLVKESVEQIATLLSDLVAGHVQEEEKVGIGDIEQGMRQILQEVGRQALGQVLEKSDQVEPSIRCQCQHKANYRCRREGMVITVFGRVGIPPFQWTSNCAPLSKIFRLNSTTDEHFFPISRKGKWLLRRY